MHEYNLVHIGTMPILILAISKLMNTFFGDTVFSKKIEIISYIAYFITTSVLIFFTRIPVILMGVNLISIFLISLNYVEIIRKRILYTIFIYSILLVMELVISGFIGFYEISIFENSKFSSTIGLILIRTTTMIVAYLINKYKVVAKEGFPIPRMYYLGILVILFGTLYLFVNSLDSDELTIYRIALSGFILVIVNITLMVLDEKIYKGLILSSKQKILMQQNEAFKSQANISSEANLTIRALKHDMINHLATLNELFKNGKRVEFESYISTIYGILNNKNLSNSNNFLFDSIINFKLKKLSDVKVDVKLDINIPPTVNILEYDITVILGNLLENAVTATLESKEKRLIISINESMESIVILIDNSYNGVVLKDGDLFKTTKKHKEDHGFGLANVKKSLQKYNGELQISYTDNIFSVAVVIPYK